MSFIVEFLIEQIISTPYTVFPKDQIFLLAQSIFPNKFVLIVTI